MTLSSNNNNNSTYLRKPEWIRVRLPHGNNIERMKKLLRSKHHATVCEEAACPNLGECFNCGTATFLIMGDICTRACRFCNVVHGVPKPLDPSEPDSLAMTIRAMKLHYAVLTSVDRDDLPDKGVMHYIHCIKAIRKKNPNITIEILTPDFRGYVDEALEQLAESPPDVFNHNIETIKRLYFSICPKADYDLSLELLRKHKQHFPHIPTKSGVMVGLGETNDEVVEVLKDLRTNNVDWLTIGQYLQPSRKNAPVKRYVTPDEFAAFKKIALDLGFTRAACGPFVRSSYHAKDQAAGKF